MRNISDNSQLKENKNHTSIVADTYFGFLKKAEDYFQQKVYDKAIYSYKKTIEINPSFPDAYFNLAIVYTKTNQIEDAIETLERVIHLCPSDASVYNNLGVLYFKKKGYLDAKTYFEIALLLNDTYKEADENIEKVGKILEETSHAKKNNQILGLIFSKDRAMQLDGTLGSFSMHCKDTISIDLKVIYKTSHAVLERQYEDLKTDYDNVEFIREENFKEQVLSLIRKYTFVLFLVDDNIFLKSFYISDLTNSLNENTNAIGFSLRLGENTVYCYSLHSLQKSPTFTHITNDILKYDWTSAELDFGYPLEVSSSLYRVKEIYPLLVQINFSNPNTLENQMAANKHIYTKTRPILLCSKLSLTFCAPLNMVQDVCNNRAGNENCYSSEMLANKFGEGYRIDVEKYIGFIPNACHQEVPLDFINSKQ
ncbi:MAG: tetratricopeptide repeat protein [Candidatus Kuenenia sp.]|nr:tetratricopeptide repeat protein [Candidatus Kuenenia hertensis]